jgi:GNAT superfamily N-acetyltransferase
MQSVASVTYHNEHMTDALWDELQPLINQHWVEVAHWTDIPLNPQRSKYFELEAAGILKIATARVDGRLIGYHFALVAPHLHYATCLVANQDVFWVHPDHRGGRVGMRLLLTAEATLRALGVQVITQHGKVRDEINIGGFLERLGYEPMDTIYVKRLDRN